MKSKALILVIISCIFFFNSSKNEFHNRKSGDEKEQSLIEKYAAYLVDENELMTSRDVSAQHFKINDSTLIACIHSRPIFYRTESGSLNKISDRIVCTAEKGWSYRNESNDILFYFSQDGCHCLVSKLDGTSLLELGLNSILKFSAITRDNNTLILDAPDASYQARWSVNGGLLSLTWFTNFSEAIPIDCEPYEIKFINNLELTHPNLAKIDNETVRLSLTDDRFVKLFRQKKRLSEKDKFTLSDYTRFQFVAYAATGTPASGRVHYDGTTFTKYDGYLQIQNTSPNGCKTGFRSWVKYDISTIPDQSEITDVEQYIYCTKIHEGMFDYLNYDIFRVDHDPITSSGQDLWSDIYDGSCYEIREWMTNPPAWEWCDLDPPGDADLQSALPSDWFGLGYMVTHDEDDADYYAFFEGVGDTNPPYLAIKYKPTALDEADIPVTHEYQLFQNYPNPFNSSTRIVFVLPRTERVVIEIFNVLGHRIKTLVDNHLPQGKNEIVFDAGNLSSGIYYYRIQTRDFQNFKKMSILK